MRQETIVKTYLKFEELNEKQRAKVLDDYRDINVDYDWYDFLIEEYTEKLESLGYENIKIEFSGFYSQGDGACFIADHERGPIYKSGQYNHSGVMQCGDLKLLIEARQIANELYRDLKKKYEYLQEDEQVAETLIANDYEFDVDTLKIG